MSPMRKLANFSEMFASGFAGLSRFRDIMATEPSQKDAADARELQQVRGQIDVQDVSFSMMGTWRCSTMWTSMCSPGRRWPLWAPLAAANPPCVS
ncbi:MAG: hypothetical protein ACLU9S_06035 [Oscillospiraceae bacterium]